MPTITTAVILTLLLAFCSAAQQVQRFISTSGVVRVASMAARDEGYNPDAEGIYLNELRTADGKEPIQGYSSIALYKHGHLVRSYSIRVDTGDVVDTTVCEIFRYPDLLSFKRKLMKGFGTKEAPLDVIESEVGCDKLRIVPTRAAAGRKKNVQP
ncbi:MAG: hypothetical protein ACHQT6_03655 [Candidatus Acidiferrales bacterium]